jgi:transposase
MSKDCDAVKIAGTKYDKRAKLSDDDRRAIIILSKEGYSQRVLAKMFKCSRWTVQNLLNPQERTAPKKRDTAYWTAAKQRYRKRKAELLKTGQIGTSKRKTTSMRQQRGVD